MKGFGLSPNRVTGLTSFDISPVVSILSPFLRERRIVPAFNKVSPAERPSTEVQARENTSDELEGEMIGGRLSVFVKKMGNSGGPTRDLQDSEGLSNSLLDEASSSKPSSTTVSLCTGDTDFFSDGCCFPVLDVSGNDLRRSGSLEVCS